MKQIAGLEVSKRYEGMLRTSDMWSEGEIVFCFSAFVQEEGDIDVERCRQL